MVYLVMAVTTMLCFFASLLAHELAHSIVARRLGVPIKNITLFMFGGVAELEAEPQSAGVEFWVALAGPAMSFALSFGFWVLAQAVTVTSGDGALAAVLSYLFTINLILALFNLVPAFPLDGGRVMRAYLWHRSGDILWATETSAKSGTMFAYFLMALGVLALFRGALVIGLWQLLIGGFILQAARASYQMQLARTAFDHKTVSDLMKRDVVTTGPDITLAGLVNTVMLAKGVSFVPVLDDGILLGYIDRTVLIGIERENWASTRVGDVFVGPDEKNCVAPDLPIQDLMTHIAKTGGRKFLVASGHALRGVISLADLTQYLQTSEIALQR